MERVPGADVFPFEGAGQEVAFGELFARSLVGFARRGVLVHDGDEGSVCRRVLVWDRSSEVP